MRHNLFLLFVVCLCTGATAQIQVGVWTDRPVYRYGDTVMITVTAFNPTGDTIHLSFPTASQANYIVDDYDLFAHNGGWTILTSARILPFSSIGWNNLKYPGMSGDQTPLSIGTHVLIGEVLGYGRSDTLRISVTKATSVAEDAVTGEVLVLGQNYPNPFNGVTWVPFALVSAGRVRMALYNALGQRICTVLDGDFSSGSHLARVEISNLPSGLYWGRLEAGGRTRTLKFVLVR